ncbi:unnamed protein product [Ectocarpus sp. CCAP 1310/34]|nr:unnamed protein product [Ectocarpus sp. CCAP 1310/34]
MKAQDLAQILDSMHLVSAQHLKPIQYPHSKAAQQQLRGASKNSAFEATLEAMLKAARKKRSIARWRALETFFEGYVRQLEKKRREGDQAGFYRHLMMIDVEGKRSFISQNIKDEDGNVLRDPTFIRQQWARWFHKLLNTKSPTIDLHATDKVKWWPTCVPLDDIPSLLEVEEAVREMANRKKGRRAGRPTG